MKAFKIIYHILTFIILFSALLIIKPIWEMIYAAPFDDFDGFITSSIACFLKEIVLWTYFPAVVLIGSQGFIYKLPVVSLVISAVNIMITTIVLALNGIVSYVARIELPYYDMSFMVNFVTLFMTILNVALCVFFIVDMRKKKVKAANQ